jgi:gliding motility-associated-like protein
MSFARYLLICTFIQLYTSVVLSQTISDGWIYGQAGRQTSHHCIVDDEDYRYNFFTSTTSFVIDSAGIPITILTNGGCALVKFNTSGVYQNHVILPIAYNFSAPYMYLTKDSNSNILLALACPIRDTIWLFNRYGQQIKRVFIPDPLQGNPLSVAFEALIILKLDKNLSLIWSTSIHKRNNRHGNQIQNIERNGLSIIQTNQNQLIINYINRRHKLGINEDSLVYTDNAEQRQIIEVTAQNILFKIDTNGNYVTKQEPFSGKLNRINSDTNFYQNRDGFHILQHGNKSFIYRTFDIYTPDTFKVNTNQSLPMKAGYNVILAQWDIAADSFDWAYLIDYDSLWFTYPVGIGLINLYRWSYDPIKQELLFAAKPSGRYTPNLLPSKFTNQEINDAEIHIVKIDLAGSIIWEDLYQNWFRLEEIYYHPQLNGFILLGNSFTTDSATFGTLKCKPISHHFIAILDSTSTPYSINDISKTRSYSWDNMTFMPRNTFTVNNHADYNWDSKGNIFISGYAERDSIVLSCKTLRSLLQQDAFILSVSPICNTDTFTCLQMQSPSMRYIWDSCGIYYDTLQNMVGCDSVIRFNLTVGKSKSTIDSAVCYSMQSPSSRHVWDSTGTFTDTIPNHLGCDSVITVRLTVKHTRDSITQSHCGIRPSPSGRFVMDTTGVYKDTLVNQFGCDSLLTIHFTQLRQTDTTLRDTLVCSYFITQRGDTIRANDIISDTLQTTLGCDSIVRYQIIIGDSTATIDTTICDQYLSPGGKLFTLPGTYADTVFNTNGCRLYYTIHIGKTSLNATIDTAVCNNFTAPSGKIFTAPGIYLDTIVSARGCDSIINFRVTKGITFQLIDTAICNNYVSPSGKLNLNSAGIYFDTITSTTGCDSLFEIRLTLDTFSVRITKSNDLTCETPTITLTADAGVRFLWHPSDFLNANDLQAVVSAPEGSIQYRLVAFSNIGCEARDSVTIEDKRIDIKLNIPNVFTPNGDNMNDDFGIDPQDDVKQMHLQIYNRWGAKIFESHSPQIRWNGQASNGNECAAGVYYYIAKGIDRCGNQFDVTGSISLIR